MAVEIRELIIKTEIAPTQSNKVAINEEEINELKQQLLAECKKMIAAQTKRPKFNR